MRYSIIIISLQVFLWNTSSFSLTTNYFFTNNYTFLKFTNALEMSCKHRNKFEANVNYCTTRNSCVVKSTVSLFFHKKKKKNFTEDIHDYFLRRQSFFFFLTDEVPTLLLETQSSVNQGINSQLWNPQLRSTLHETEPHTISEAKGSGVEPSDAKVQIHVALSPQHHVSCTLEPSQAPIFQDFNMGKSVKHAPVILIHLWIGISQNNTRVYCPSVTNRETLLPPRWGVCLGCVCL